MPVAVVDKPVRMRLPSPPQWPPPLKRSREGTGGGQEAPRKSLSMELLALGSKEALHNSKKIPNLAKWIATEHLPTAGAAKVLRSMATVFLRQDVL